MNLLLAFVGSILLYLAPFMNWIWEKLFDVKRKANLFEIGMKSSMVEEDGSILAMGETIVLVLGIIAILVGVWMLLLSACDYIKWLRKYAANPIMRFAPILVMLVIFIIVINNKHYTQSLRVLEDNVRLAKELGTSSNYDAEKVTFYQPDGTTLEGAKNVDGTKEKPGAIPQLLNMDAGQFMQVAMIAQGEFWKLLNAKTNERTEILHSCLWFDIHD